MHCHATPLLHSRQHQQAHHIFPTNARLRRSLASPDARATLPIRPARPLPRALAAHSACDASPPRSRRDPGVLMRMQHCACPTDGCKPRPLAKSLLQLPLLLKPAACTQHSQRGIAKVRGIQGTRAGDRGRAADDRIRDAMCRLAAMPTE